MKLLSFLLSVFIASSVLLSGCISNENANKPDAATVQETPAPENKTLPDKWAVFVLDNASFPGDYEFMVEWKNFTRDNYGFPEQHILCIFDEGNFSKANIAGALKWMIDNTGENSTAVFSFDGHGSAGIGEGNRILSSSIYCGDGSLSDYEIGELMKNWTCKKFLFLSEGCQNGFMCDDLSNPITGSAPGVIAPGRVIISASCEATFAWSNGTGPLFHQCFYYGLLNNAADGWDAFSNDATGPIGEKDGKASVEEAFWYGRNHVWPAEDFAMNMEAQPKMNDGIEGDFFL